MKLPPGIRFSEEEVLIIIQKVVNTLAAKLRFGYHEVEDMKQQGALYAIKVLSEADKYDVTKPLENFLYTHIRNRFINYKRDNYVRSELPCKTCIFFDPKFKKSTSGCAAFADKSDCKKLSDWRARNEAKRSLMKPVDMNIINEGESADDFNVIDSMSFIELEQLIDKHLDVELRSDYLRMRQQQPIPKSRRKRVQEAVLAIKEEFYDENEEG